MQPLSADEADVADQAAELLDSSIGSDGRAILARLPGLWAAVAAFGTGVTRVQVRGAGLDPARTVAVTVGVFIRAGMAADVAAEATWQTLQQEGAPAVKGMIGEGDRVAAQWEESGEDSPGVLGAYLAQMEELAGGRS